MVLAMVPAAPPTRKNQRTTSWPAPISANVPYRRGSRLIVSAFAVGVGNPIAAAYSTYHLTRIAELLCQTSCGSPMPQERPRDLAHLMRARSSSRAGVRVLGAGSCALERGPMRAWARAHAATLFRACLAACWRAKALSRRPIKSRSLSCRPSPLTASSSRRASPLD